MDVNVELHEVNFKLLNLKDAPKTDLLDGVDLPELKKPFNRNRRDGKGKNNHRNGNRNDRHKDNRKNGYRGNRNNNRRRNNQHKRNQDNRYRH